MHAATKPSTPRRPAPDTHAQALTAGARQRVKTATSATSGWAKRLQARLARGGAQAAHAESAAPGR